MKYLVYYIVSVSLVITILVLGGVVSAQSLSLVRNQTAPWMMGCPYSMNIVVNSPIPSAVVDVFFTYPTGQLAGMGFVPGNAYSAATVPIAIKSGSVDVRRFSTDSVAKTNAIIGSFSFTSLPMMTGLSFVMPFIIESKIEGNNLPDTNGRDTLQQVSGLSYTFLTGPCVQDLQAPFFINHQVQDLNNNRVNGINAYRIRPDSDVRMTITDVGGPLGYGYNPSNQYVSNQADIQWGVDLASLSIMVDGVVYMSSSPQFAAGPFDITRERLDRNYVVTINPSAANFGIEREIIVTGQVRDRMNRRGNTNLGQFSYSFNKSRQPIVQPLNPLANATAVNPNIKPFMLRVRDDRAGVDSSSISVTLDGIVYTPNSLGFSFITGAFVTGGDWMDISIIPVTGFQIASLIPVIVNGRDRIGTIISSANNYSFTTRAQCALYGCGGEPLELRYNGIMTMYDKPRLVVTGGAVTVSGDLLIFSGISLQAPAILTQTALQYVTQYLPLTVAGADRIVYVASGDRIISLQGTERIIIKPGETVTRYVAGKPVEVYRSGLLVIREIAFVTGVTKVMTGDAVYVTGETQIIIQTGEVIKYINSGSTDIYVGDDRNNVSIKPIETQQCPALEPLTPEIIEIVSVNRWPFFIGLMIGLIGLTYGVSQRRLNY